MLITSYQELEDEPEQERLRISEELLEKVQAFKSWPLSRTRVEVPGSNGALTVIIEPASWTYGDLINMIICGEELYARALEGRTRFEMELGARRHEAAARQRLGALKRKRHRMLHRRPGRKAG